MYWFLSYITWSDVKDIFAKSESQFSYWLYHVCIVQLLLLNKAYNNSKCTDAYHVYTNHVEQRLDCGKVLFLMCQSHTNTMY